VSPYSLPVLGGATLVSSPVLWRALVQGTAPIEVALIRYLVCVVLVWAMMTVVSIVVGPAPSREAGEGPESEEGLG
jgi:hypothetical protein